MSPSPADGTERGRRPVQGRRIGPGRAARLTPMPSRTPPASVASAQLRRVQERLPALSVPVLLRVRDAVEQVLDADRVAPRDVEAVLTAAGTD